MIYNVVFTFTDPKAAFAFLRAREEQGYMGIVTDATTGEEVDEDDARQARYIVDPDDDWATGPPEDISHKLH